MLSVSAIGLKYLELEKGTSSRTLKAGETIPVAQTREPVDIIQLFNMFDPKTRTAIQHNTINFGDGLAGRGLGLNETIATLRPLVTDAIPVLHNLAAPQTDFARPVPRARPARLAGRAGGRSQGRVFSELDTFFSAWAGVAPSLEQTIAGGPAALAQATYSLPYEAPLVEKSHRIHAPAAPDRERAAISAADAGTRVHGRRGQPARRHRAEQGLAEASTGVPGVRPEPGRDVEPGRPHADDDVGEPLFGGLAPEQAYCNYLTLVFRNVASLLAENIGVGTLARAAAVLSPNGPNAEGFPSSAPANGPSVEKNSAGAKPVPINDNHLHVNPYPNVAGPGQPRVCEAGNETYLSGKTVIGNLPGTPARQPRIDHPRTEPVRRRLSVRDTRSLGLRREEGEQVE